MTTGKCNACGTSLVELVSVKDPDIITIVCFNCGVIVNSYHKDHPPDEEIEIEGNGKV